MTVGVAIPTYHRPGSEEFLARAIRSVLRQTVPTKIVVAHNKGQSFAPIAGATVIESPGATAAANTNAAANELGDCEFLAILEDDDWWDPDHLAVMLGALAHTKASFASASPLEVDSKGTIMRVHDFAVPSGWVMPRDTWDALLGFDETWRTHQDNDFLGRVNENRWPRVHVVEATAPMTFGWSKGSRPGLAQIEAMCKMPPALARHTNPYPLVKKTVHPAAMSWSWQQGSKTESEAELERLKQRFGVIPW